MLTAGDAAAHVKQTLGHDPDPSLSSLTIANQAGRVWAAMHSWRCHDRRTATLAVGAGRDYALLPPDFGSLIAVSYDGSPGRALRIGSHEDVFQSRLAGTISGQAWLAAVTSRTLPAANLLAYSEVFDQSPTWSYQLGTGTVTPNAVVNPYTGAVTVPSVSDSDLTDVSEFGQTVYPAVLADGPYTCTWVIRPSPILSTNPHKTGLLIRSESPGSGGLLTRLEVQWGGTPWQTAPTLTVIGTNSGGAVPLAVVGAGEGFWQISLSGYAYLKAVNFGRILCTVEPTRALWTDASGTSDPTLTGAVNIARMWLNEGYAPTDYAATDATVQAIGTTHMVLELDRAPDTSSATALQLVYRGTWVDVEDDEDQLPLPGAAPGQSGYCDLLYLQILRALARGWEEEGDGTFDARLEQIKRGPVFAAATEHDGGNQFSRGRMSGGAVAAARRYLRTPEFETDWTNYAGPM